MVRLKQYVWGRTTARATIFRRLQGELGILLAALGKQQCYRTHHSAFAQHRICGAS